MKKYKLEDTETGEILEMSISEILEEVNRDRPPDWTDYNRTDWREGLEQWTDYKLI